MSKYFNGDIVKALVFEASMDDQWDRYVAMEISGRYLIYVSSDPNKELQPCDVTRSLRRIFRGVCRPYHCRVRIVVGREDTPNPPVKDDELVLASHSGSEGRALGGRTVSFVPSLMSPSLDPRRNSSSIFQWNLQGNGAIVPYTGHQDESPSYETALVHRPKTESSEESEPQIEEVSEPEPEPEPEPESKPQSDPKSRADKDKDKMLRYIRKLCRLYAKKRRARDPSYRSENDMKLAWILQQQWDPANLNVNQIRVIEQELLPHLSEETFDLSLIGRMMVGPSIDEPIVLLADWICEAFSSLFTRLTGTQNVETPQLETPQVEPVQEEPVQEEMVPQLLAICPPSSDSQLELALEPYKGLARVSSKTSQ